MERVEIVGLDNPKTKIDDNINAGLVLQIQDLSDRGWKIFELQKDSKYKFINLAFNLEPVKEGTLEDCVQEVWETNTSKNKPEGLEVNPELWTNF